MYFRTFVPSPWYEQWALFLSGFFIKPVYMLLSLVLIIVLWRQKAADLAALRRGLTCFLIGEGFCAMNYLVFTNGSHLFEYLHSYGMVLCFGFVTYAILEGMDLRMINYTDPKKKCAALGLCRQCIKYTDALCGLKWMFYFLIPAHIVLAFIPLCVSPKPVSYNSEILGVFYNYSHPLIYQIFEIRYCPAYAIILFTVSWLILLFKKKDAVALSRVLFCAGMGPLGFGFLRLILFSIYRDNLVWFTFWEEMSELMFVGGAGFVLWIFRHSLFEAKEELEPASAAPSAVHTIPAESESE
jgi:hypothetical protein